MRMCACQLAPVQWMSEEKRDLGLLCHPLRFPYGGFKS